MIQNKLDYKAINFAYPNYSFLLFCDMDGALEVWVVRNISDAEKIAAEKQDLLDQHGYDYAAYRAVTRLPRKKIYKFHGFYVKNS